MQGLVYADLTRHRLTTSLGGGAFTFPDLVSGDEVRLGLRLTESLNGGAIEVDRTVNAVKASLGFVDLRPTGGTWALVIDANTPTTGVNLTPALQFDASASTIQTQLDALSAGVSPFNVVAVTGGFVVYMDSGAQLPDLAAYNVALDPISFVKIREFQINGDYRYEIRLTQAPLASTSSFDLIVPPAPAITSVQDGGEDAGSGASWNEIQALTVNPAFRGTYQIRRGFKKTDLLSVEDGPEEIEEALAALADDGEEFRVTNPTANVAHIEFAGDAGGINQDLLTVQVFSAPPGDPTFVLNLNTQEVFAALRTATEIKPTLEIELTIEDENDPLEEYTITIFRGEVTLVKELQDEATTVAANVDWLQTPAGKQYPAFGVNQIITGSQHYSATVGDGVSSILNIAHNLNTQDVQVSVYNASTGAQYRDDQVDVTVNSVNDLDLDFTAGAPALNGVRVVITSAGPASAFQAHNHAIAEVTGLQTLLDDLGVRLQTIEGLVPTGAISSSSPSSDGVLARWTLPDLFEVYPSRGQDATKATTVSGIDQNELPRKGGRLLPSKYDSAPTDAAALPGSPATNVVYRCTNASGLTLPGAGGIRSRTIKKGDFFAYDGEGFYQVENVLHADSEWFAPVGWETFAGSDEFTLTLPNEDALFGKRATSQGIGLVEIRDISASVSGAADGIYPYSVITGGTKISIIDNDSKVANSGALSGNEMIRPINSNRKFDVSQFVVSGGGTLITLTIPGSDEDAYGFEDVYGFIDGDFGASGYAGGVDRLTSIGSDQWTISTSGANDGTYTDAITVEMPSATESHPDATPGSGDMNRFYPVDFRRELFRLHVSEKQLRLKKTLAIDFSIEAAAIKSNATVQWGVLLQFGEIIEDKTDLSNLGEGSEHAGIRWSKPSLDHVIHLTGVPSSHSFGLRVYRSAADVLTCSSVLYGNEEGGAIPPRTPNFVVRALLHRFDVGDYESDPTAFLAISGLSVDGAAQGEASIS